MKKSVKILVISLIILSAVFGGFSANAAETDKELDVKIGVGFNNAYKIGYSTPININIKNNYKDINGEVEVRVPSSPGKYMSYVKPISLQKDAEKSITINVPIGDNNRTKYAVNIYDGEDKVCEDSVTIIASNNTTAFIGILSDDFDSLSYINSAPASTGVTLLTKNIKLDEKNFPEDIFTLNAFNILVINDFDTSRFNKSQYEILKQWVRNGGTLIIGTGSKYNKTLSIFKDDFIEGTQGSVQDISTSRIYDLATNGDNRNETKVDVLTLNIKDSSVLMEDKGVSLVQAHASGKGVVGILAFDLGKAPFVNWNNNTAFMEKILALVNPELTNMNNSNNSVNYFRNNTYVMQEAVNQFSEMASAKTSSYYLILFIYVLVVAPISYFILKKLDKRGWMWLTVPVLAIVFGSIVYITGSGTRLSKVTTNMISYISLDKNGNASTDTYAGILNTNKSKVRISGQNGERILPVSSNYYSENTSGKEILEAKVNAGENGSIEYRNSSLLETKILQLQENSINLGTVEAKLSLKNGKITGSIKNSTNLDLVDCLILLPNSYYKIDSLKIGEIANLDGMNLINHGGNIQQMIQDTFFNRGYSGKNEAEKKKYMDLRQEGNILQRMYNYGNAQIEGIKLIAFSKTQIHQPMLVNGTPARKNERNILIMPLDVKLTNGDTVEYPMGFVPYEVKNTSNLNYDMSNKMFYGNGSADLLYKIDKDIVVEEFGINTSTVQYKTINSNFYIYNIKKETNEPIKDMVISGENLKNYLAPDNTVKIRLEVTDGEIGVPQMAAKGRKK
ncbi:MAG: hypothetical protein K0R50_1956 [Eubacterium sp.]|nr:hypothetical protein [Eubacterium sp.]